MVKIELAVTFLLMFVVVVLLCRELKVIEVGERVCLIYCLLI
jgi:hypothetical protein